MKKQFVVAGIIILLLFLIPICIYIIKFRSYSFSGDPADWGVFGDYMAGTLGAVLAIAGLFVAYVINETTLKKQQMQLRPLAYINAGDFEDSIFVGIINSGLGPLLITNIKVKNLKGDVKNNVIDWMPELPDNIMWSNFFGQPIGYVVKVGEEVPLVSIKSHNIILQGDIAGQRFSDENLIEHFAETRDKIRKALCELSVELEYEDVYGNKMPIRKRELDWFKRNLKSD